MSKLILTDDQKTQLDGSTEVLVFDQAGQVVGHFLTPDEYTKLIYAWAKEEFAKEDLIHPIDDEDEEGSMTTAEVLAYLQSLDSRESGAA